ncbi:MAG: hypothetical protein ABRQ37_02885 [Candidatus Eremiobacterota bacterium]
MNKRETSSDTAFAYITGCHYPHITCNSLSAIKEQPLAIKDTLDSVDLYHMILKFIKEVIKKLFNLEEDLAGKLFVL